MIKSSVINHVIPLREKFKECKPVGVTRALIAWSPTTTPHLVHGLLVEASITRLLLVVAVRSSTSTGLVRKQHHARLDRRTASGDSEVWAIVGVGSRRLQGSQYYQNKIGYCWITIYCLGRQLCGALFARLRREVY